MHSGFWVPGSYGLQGGAWVMSIKGQDHYFWGSCAGPSCCIVSLLNPFSTSAQLHA